MVLDNEIRRKVEKKGNQFDEAKERAMERIRRNIAIVKEKLEIAEQELLGEVAAEFGENPFSDFLCEDDHTEEEIRSILSVKIPNNFGPGEELYCSLFKDIESLRTWSEDSNSPDLVPKNLRCTGMTGDSATIAWDHVDLFCSYDIELKSPLSTRKYRTFDSEYTLCELDSGTEYQVRVRTLTTQNSKQCLWSNPITIKAKSSLFNCSWKECPNHMHERRKYSVDEKNPRIVSNVGGSFCTAIGNTPIPLNQVTSWNINILRSKDNNGNGICVGVAPSDINQNIDNRDKCGWYFNCFNSMLLSGPPHNYSFSGKEYGPRKGDGQYVHTGDSVGVVMDTTRGELSFVVNGVNHGVAYEGIPLDKPLVPCAILGWKNDYVELIC